MEAENRVLRDSLQDLRDTVSALRDRIEEPAGTIRDLRDERDRLRAELERRRWPGLWPALVRFWRGEGGG